MQIEAAIRQYLTGLKETAPRAQVEAQLAVLARLQEYLDGDPELESAEQIGAGDLRGFIRYWYREDEAVTPVAAKRLVDAVVGWSEWLDRRRAGSGGPASEGAQPQPGQLAASLAPLGDSLPRAIYAAELLRRHARRDDLSEAIPVEGAPGGSPLGTVSAGVTRVMRPAEIDYGGAEEDDYQVAVVEERSVVLRSDARERLGEGAAGPVFVPARAARLLRVGDILHAEIAPTPAGWEILNLETIYPGELNVRP